MCASPTGRSYREFHRRLAPRGVHPAVRVRRVQDYDFIDFLSAALRDRFSTIVYGREYQGVPRPNTSGLEPQSREDRLSGFTAAAKTNTRVIAQFYGGQKTPRPEDRGGVCAMFCPGWMRSGGAAGTLFFVRMPVSGSLRRLEERTYPDADPGR